MMQKQKGNWVFFSALPPFRGGISKFSAATFLSLEEQLHIKGFTFKQQYPNFLFPGSSQLDTSALHTQLFPRVASTFYPWTYLHALYIFRKEKPEVFVTSYWMTFFAPMMAFWAFFLPKHVKKIAIIHNLKPHESRFFDRSFNRLFLKYYDGFIVLSESVGNEIKDIKPSAHIKHIAHPPYDIDQTALNAADSRKHLGLDPSKKTILFFGLIRPYKGLIELIEAFHLLDDEYQLLIAGEVYGSSAVYEQALAQSPNKNWKFINQFIPNAEVAIYFQAADLVVLPYVSATQSGVRSLALAQKRPVLCTDVGGLAEGLHEKNEGFKLEQLAAVPFASRIKNLFESGEIEACKQGLTQKKTDTNQAWLDFATAIIDFSKSV